MNKDIAEIKNLQEFAELFERLFSNHDFAWREYPNRIMGLCPFHGEKRHSFNIFQAPDGTFCYKCFSCGESGSVYKLLKQFGLLKDSGEVRSYGNPLYPVAVEFVKLAQRELLSLPLDSGRIEVLFNKIYKKANNFEDKEKKQLLSSIVDYFGIGIITKNLIEKCRSDENLKKFLSNIEEKIHISDRIGYFIFPYYTLSGHLSHIKFRDLDGTSRTSRIYKLYKNVVSCFFGGLGFLRNYVKQRDGEVLPVFVTEGETDSMSFFADSFLPCLAVGSASNYKYLLEDRVSQFDFFPVILPDFDPYMLKSAGAGREAIIKLYEERRQKKIREKIYVLTDPESYNGRKDVNDAINDGKSFREILNGSIKELTQARKEFLEDYQEWKYEQFLRKKEKLEKNIPGFANVYADFLGISDAIEEEEYEFSVEQILESETEEYEALLDRFPQYLVSVIASFGGVGKTTFSILTAYRLAFSYYNPYELRILVWTTEHRPFSLKKRIKQIENVLSQEEVEIARKQIFFTNRTPVHFVSEKKQLNKKAFELIEKLLEKYDVLFLDPLLSFLGCEENDNSTVRAVFDKLHAILGKFVESGKPKVIVFLHHFNKLAIGNTKIKEEDITRYRDSVEIKYEKVLDLVASVRGASAVVDSARYCEAIVKTDESRYCITIKTNEDCTRREGIGEEVPDLYAYKESEGNNKEDFEF